MSRLQIFKEELKKLGAEAALLRAPETLLYLSGFTGGEGSLIISDSMQYLLTDSRYTLQAKEEAPQFEVLPHDTPLSSLLNGISAIAIESDRLTVSEFETLKEVLPDIEWKNISESLLLMRKTKDISELSRITEAVKIADDALKYTLQRIRPGMREFEVAAMLEFYMRRSHGALPSFDTVCASGKRSALPHGTASHKIIEKGDFLTIDFGCYLNGYCSDITRTVCVGPASEKQKEIYGIVLYAQTKAASAAAANMSAASLDAVARDVIKEYGYGEYFGHALGHGVGLAIHEYPNVSPRSLHSICDGDVLTIEPGIYIPDFGGVRIEDIVYITNHGHAVLTKSPKDLIEII